MHNLRVTRLTFLVGCAFIAANCNNSHVGQDPGIEGPASNPAIATAPDTTPEGIAYPTTNLGTSARAGAKRGSTMRNYKFLGLPRGTLTQALEPISMASLYDPSGTRTKLIHIQASATWCGYCQAEAEAAIALSEQLAERKVVWLMSLAEGPTPGRGATKDDLNAWVAKFTPSCPQVLDSGHQNFGAFYDAAAVPWNANIDARTMEILSSGVGALVNEAAVLADVDGWLAKIDRGDIAAQP